MSYMFEVYYKAPMDSNKEAALTQRIASLGGVLSYRELPDDPVSGSICLTYEFNDLKRAETAAVNLHNLGEHVEGPVDYGPPNQTEVPFPRVAEKTKAVVETLKQEVV